jgi:NADH-ubiquinone oxidoreductase chain 3
MTIIITFILLTIILPIVIIILTVKIKYTDTYNREKSSPFECGFDPKNTARIPFSARFFLLAVIFLIFDVEIVMLIPMPLILKHHYPIFFILTSSLFLFILLIGLIHEWNEGSLRW